MIRLGYDVSVEALEVTGCAAEEAADLSTNDD